jgi:hypothetical protein
VTSFDTDTNDPAAQYKKLRAATVEMLGLGGENNLTPVQSLQIDLISVLLLEIDSLQGQQLAGQPIDMSRLATALSMLQKLMPPTSLSPTLSEPNFDGAAAEFARLIAQRATSLEARRDFLHEQEIARLTALIAQKDEVIERLSAATPPKAGARVAEKPLLPPAQTSSQPPLHSSSAPFVRRGGDVVEIGRGYDRWSNRQ